MWKQEAEALFFKEHKNINEIAALLGRARETVSRCICRSSGYPAEMEYRKKLSAEKRREYQHIWDKECRKRGGGETAGERYSMIMEETVRREHETAVRILSRERFF